MPAARTTVFPRWTIAGLTTLVLILIVAASLATYGTTEESFRFIIRATARLSLALFTCAFVAEPLHTLLRPNAATLHLRTHQPGFFLSLALSHLVHLLAIIAVAKTTGGASLAATPLTEILGGALAYVFIAAFALASLSGARRTSSSAPPAAHAWPRLHSFGMHYVWFIFMFSYGARAARSLAYLPFALLLVGALALRLCARFQAQPSRRTMRAK
ncbi:MAG TPA: hypothetical protein VNA19_10555 [Pyrinomonadaceae bacterium]|jgi:uncharacterized membrane protein|nr:hypothetical protein [Pyrinomonadaceae bacterium]